MNATTMHLISGVEFDFADPMACEEITDHDVAHALARETRYGGHCTAEWSVAQHTLLTAVLVKHWYRQPDMAFAALHHDDAEFVTKDWPTPLKAYLHECGVDYARALERPVEFALAKHLGLVVDDLHAGVVKDADAAAYEIEISLLKPQGHSSVQELDEDLMELGQGILRRFVMLDVATAEALWRRAHKHWGQR